MRSVATRVARQRKMIDHVPHQLFKRSQKPLPFRIAFRTAHAPPPIRAIMNGVDGWQCCEAAWPYGVRFPLTGTPETRRLPARWQSPALPLACASEPTASTENRALRSLVSQSVATATTARQRISRPAAASSRGMHGEPQWCYAASRGISPRTARRQRREMR